jgi:uncharacterized membrane protein HdeD (DUF308 family)
MLEALARHWVLLMLRSSLALIFGVTVLVWPGLRLSGLVLLFGAYALSDGVLALMLAWAMRGTSGFGSLLLESIVRLAVGLLAWQSPGVMTLALVDALAAWALLSGLAALGTAAALRPLLSGEWPLPYVGALSLVLALMLEILRSVPPDLFWVVGPYSILFGGTLAALALRLRHLAEEIEASTTLIGG